jgi:penicillin-binding protein A
VKPKVRPVAVSFLGLVALTALWLTYVSADAGSRYRDDPRNLRTTRALDGPRGDIVTADGVVVARDGESGGREYPRGPSYAHLVGYDTGNDAAGVEATRRIELLSRDDGSLTSLLMRLTGADLGPPDIRLTVVDSVQATAVDALSGHTGAVIALDPSTGAVIAYASSPSFDPNDLVRGTADPVDDVTLDRVSRRLLPPGSTFKVVVAAAALDAGAGLDTAFEDSDSYTPPTGQPIRNAGGGVCGDGRSITLLDALVVSCNTVFAQLAADLGGLAVVGTAQRFGFNAALPWELGAERSVIPSAASLDADVPSLAQSGIGERDVRVTPLLMAMIAAAVANDGVAMAPYVVDSVVAPNGSVVSATTPRSFGRSVTADVSAGLARMMIEVVARGTGTGAAVPEVQVAGKTGTAEGGGGPHAWFIGFAPAEDPRIAVAVVIESGGSGTSGGRTAAPIAARVIAAYMESSR